MDRIRTWDSIKNAKQTYCPALLSNGALCTLLDYHGDQQQLALRPEVRYAEHGSFAHFKQMHANFFRAGLRRGDLQRNLISLGHFEEELNGQWRQPLHARQTLNLGAGVTTCANEYGQGVKVETQAFVHKQESVFALHKEFTNVTAYSLHYFFAEENSRDQVRWSEFSARKSRNGSAVTAHWKTAGFHGDDTGTIVLRCSQPCLIEIQGCRVSFLLEGPLEQADFFLIFTDTLYEGEKERTEALRLRRLTERAGFSGLLRQQQALWSAFWDAFILELPDAAIQETFETALYSLECNSTRWTLPVCINNSAWKGAYFAFNLFTEIFFATGHPQESLKIAAFRHKLLEQAYRRASNRRRQGARYPWLCDEDGVWDVASPGIWTDHVFQMCNIALEVWNCFLYTQDKRLLSEKVLLAMVETGRFHFIKDTCCDAALIARRVELLKGSIQLFNANCATFLETLKTGADGFSGIMANYHPDLLRWLYTHYQSQPEKARWLSAMLSVMSLVEGCGHPAAVKYHMNLLGIPMELRCRSIDAAKRFGPLDRHAIDDLLIMEEELRTWIKA